jgi:predicted nucleic acid-binding protein
VSGLVLDASAALTLVAGGPGRTVVRTELRDRVLAGGAILVPTLFWVQLVDGLTARHRLAPRAAVEAVYELEQLGIETAEVGRPGVLAIIDAVGRGLSAADAAYLVLAESADARLLTGVPLLAAVAGDRAIFAGSGRRAGRRPRPDGSWARWRGAATYLRELRSAL